MIQKKRFFVGAAAIVLLFVVGLYTYKHFAGAKNTAEPGGMPPTAVETAKAVSEPVSTEISAVGSLLANESVVITPERAGRVTAINFEEGQAVEKGHVLIELDTESLQAELDRAQASLHLAQETYERVKTLKQRGNATQAMLDEATSQLQSAQAAANLSQVALEKAKLVAPFEGTVGLRSVSLGAYVTPGQPLFTLADTDPIKVDFVVPEVYMNNVKVGQAVEVKVDALPNQAFQGEIFAVDPVVDVNGRAIAMRAKIDNPEGVLKPGLFARINIIVDTRPNAITIPESAIVPQGEDKYVFVVKEGKAYNTKIEIGKRLEGRVEVTQGLEAGAEVITAGQTMLQNGAPVMISPPPEKAPAQPAQKDSAK